MASAEAIVASLQRAIELDPRFTPAYARLADFYGFLSMRGLMDPAESYLEARRLAGKAVELDPELAEARAVLARILFTIRHTERGLELRPGLALLEQVLAWSYSFTGRHDEARSLCQELLNRLAGDYDPMVLMTCGTASGLAGREKEADSPISAVGTPRLAVLLLRSSTTGRHG